MKIYDHDMYTHDPRAINTAPALIYSPMSYEFKPRTNTGRVIKMWDSASVLPGSRITASRYVTILFS